MTTGVHCPPGHCQCYLWKCTFFCAGMGTQMARVFFLVCLFWFSFCWFVVCFPPSPTPNPSSYFSAIKSFGSASPLATSRDSSINPSAEFYSLMDSNKHIPGRQPWHPGTARLRPATSHHTALLWKEKTAHQLQRLVKIPPKSAVHPEEKTYAGDDKKLIFSVNSRTRELGCYRSNSFS